MSSANRVQISYVKENDWGETPPSPTMKLYRDTADTLSHNTTTTTSQELRADRQITDLILTSSEPGGTIDSELSFENNDTFFESAFFNTWNELSITGTDIAADGNTFTGTFTETPIIGQFILVDGFTNEENNGLFKVVSADSTTITVVETLATEPAGNSITIKGDTLTDGTNMVSLTVERYHSDLPYYFTYRGMVVNTMSMTINASEIITTSFDFIGKDTVGSETTTVSGYEPAPSYDVMTAITNVGDVYINSMPFSDDILIKSCDFTLNNNIRGLDALSHLGNADIVEGSIELTGTLSTYFKTGDLFNKFIDNEAVSLDFTLEDGDNKYVLSFPKVKFSADRIDTPGLNQDVMEDLEFQAINDPNSNRTVIMTRM